MKCMWKDLVCKSKWVVERQRNWVTPRKEKGRKVGQQPTWEQTVLWRSEEVRKANKRILNCSRGVSKSLWEIKVFLSVVFRKSCHRAYCQAFKLMPRIFPSGSSLDRCTKETRSSNKQSSLSVRKPSFSTFKPWQDWIGDLRANPRVLQL